jgi:putative serine protease PepD
MTRYNNGPRTHPLACAETPVTLDRDPCPAPSAVRRRGAPGATLRLAVVAAILSAALASGGTAALLLATAPATAPTGTAATAASADPTSAPGSATLTRLDATSSIAAVAAEAEPSVVTIAASGGGRFASSGGSGIVVSAGGLILTTAVVAAADTTYTILFSDQSEAAARVVASDEARGLVLLQAGATGLTPARLAASADLAVGELVVAIGSPLGEFTDTVTSGIVSGLGRSVDLRDPSTGRRVALAGLIQTDAAINAGSSGGPLLDASGAVVGVIAASAGSGQGIGFAIPIEDAAALVARAGS